MLLTNIWKDGDVYQYMVFIFASFIFIVSDLSYILTWDISFSFELIATHIVVLVLDFLKKIELSYISEGTMCG